MILFLEKRIHFLQQFKVPSSISPEYTEIVTEKKSKM